MNPDTTKGPGSIPLVTLDDECNDRHMEDLRLIKIDVEGMEVDVLSGALSLIYNHRPLLCIEIHNIQQLWQAASNDNYWPVKLVNPGKRIRVQF